MKRELAEKHLWDVVKLFPDRQLQVARGLLFKAPIGNVLCGLFLESSAFSAEVFNPSVFVQPMFQKSSSLVLSLGQRFLGKWTSADTQVVERLSQQLRVVGLPLWSQYDSTEKLAALPPEPRLPLRTITSGYALILCHNFEEAARKLRIADKDLERIYGDQRKANPSFWPNAEHAEVAEMLNKLQSDPEAAIQTLMQWRQFTLNELKLSEFASEAASA